MAKEPLPMCKIESILYLHHTQGHSVRKIARSSGLKRSTVNDYLQRASTADIGWPLPSDWNEQDLHRALFGGSLSSDIRPLADLGYIHTELRKKSVTLQLLHAQYFARPSDG